MSAQHTAHTPGPRLIETHYDYPPIPDRRWDWSAHLTEWDLGDLIGHGPTEFHAIVDLLVQMEFE